MVARTARNDEGRTCAAVTATPVMTEPLNEEDGVRNRVNIDTQQELKRGHLPFVA